MGSGNVGQRARLETAEVCNRGQRRDLTAGACAAGDRERNGVWCCVQVTKREKPTQRLQDGETKMYRVPSLDFAVIGLIPNTLKPRLWTVSPPRSTSEKRDLICLERGSLSFWVGFIYFSPRRGQHPRARLLMGCERRRRLARFVLGGWG